MDISHREGGSLLSGTLLVAGTSIGAGMLAMPVVTGVSGFLPGMLVNALCWLFMLATGLLMLEVTLWMHEGAHMLSMTKRFLGRFGELLGGGAFLFLYYCLIVSYFSGGVPLFSESLRGFGVDLSDAGEYVLFGLLFGGIVFWGFAAIDNLNRLLFVAMVISYVLLIGIGGSAVNLHLLKRAQWSGSWLAVPTLFGAYGYHNIIPSIASYLKRDVVHLRWAIVLGTTITFVVYTLWQWMVIGSLSEEVLVQAAAEGGSIGEALLMMTHSRWVPILGTYFALFALVTSLLGVAFSMVDFIGDGLSVSRKGWSRFGLCLLVFVPPLLFAQANPGIFIQAIGYAGGFGEALLNGALPVLMVWVGRYVMKLDSAYRLPGGKPVLALLFVLTLAVASVELYAVLT